ncbi:MAG: hypothetical protein ACKV1O_04935 [Saprospiraceae bacterium]
MPAGGQYKTGYQQLRLEFLGLPNSVAKVLVDGKETAFQTHAGRVVVALKDGNFGEVVVEG